MRRKFKTKKAIIFALVVFMLLSFVPLVDAVDLTEISFEPENISVTIDSSFLFYLNVTADADDPCSGWEIEILNFTVGIINISSVIEGEYLSDFGSTAFTEGTINNTSGNITGTFCFTIGGENSTSDGSICSINGNATGVGVSPINFSIDLSYMGNPLTVSFNFGNITVHPTAVSGSTAETHSHNRINLTWTTPFGNGTDKCVVFANSTGSAVGKNPGDEIYNGTSDHYNHTGLSPEQEWNYSFWGWNETAGLYSMLFQQASNTTDSAPVGGTCIMLGDPSPANDTNYAYKTEQGVSIPIVAGYITDTIDGLNHGAFEGASDELTHDYICQIINVSFGATWWNETTDYIVDYYEGVIDWSPAGDEPAPGAMYSVEYTYIYDTSSSFTYWINTTTGQKTESSVSSGTKSYTMTGITGGRQWWNVTAIYEGNTTQGNYTFYVNQKPQGGGDGGDWNEDPPNSAPSISVSTALSVDVEDLDGDTVNVTFYWQNDTRIDNDTVAGAGVASVNPSTLDYNTEYGWYVIADDFTDTTRGPTSGYWTFNTSTLGIDLTKEWVINSENNTIRSWINVTNTGSTNFTNVDIWDIEHSDLNLISYNHSGDFSGNGHWTWTIPYLNISGYDNHWYNITMLHGIYDDLVNNTEFWNKANLSHLGLTDSENVSDYNISISFTKQSNLSMMNDTELDVTWWINITNSGDFNLTNVTVNETYDSFINYTSSNVDPEDEGNDSFVIPYIKPSETFSLMVNISATADSITNGSRVYNNATIRSDQLEEQTLSEYLVYGGQTESLRITYDTTFTDVSSYGDTLVIIIGVLLTISALLLIIGLLHKFGYFGRGGQ